MRCIKNIICMLKYLRRTLRDCYFTGQNIHERVIIPDITCLGNVLILSLYSEGAYTFGIIIKYLSMCMHSR